MKFGEWSLPKYLVAGAINTGATYLLYLLLVRVLPYLWAYSLTFAAGIVIGYLINSLWVFKARMQWRSIVSYPLAYVFNYAFGVLLLWLLVEQMQIPKEVAPLLVVIVSMPAMYLLTKTIFHGGKNRGRKTEHQ